MTSIKTKYGQFDIVIGGDLIYSRDAIEPLLSTVTSLLKEDGEFILIYVERGTP